MESQQCQDIQFGGQVRYDISQFKVWGYSTVGDPRANKFKLFVSADNVAWFEVVDHSHNTTVQPADCWTFNV